MGPLDRSSLNRSRGDLSRHGASWVRGSLDDLSARTLGGDVGGVAKPDPPGITERMGDDGDDCYQVRIGHPRGGTANNRSSTKRDVTVQRCLVVRDGLLAYPMTR
jgi:hypothetical protein